MEALALYLAYRDPRIAWYARLSVAAILLYLFSPIDLIPDVIPILGYLDELVLMPLFIAIARRLIPAPVLADARARAAESVGQESPRMLLGAGIVVLVWVAVSGVAMAVVWNRFLR